MPQVPRWLRWIRARTRHSTFTATGRVVVTQEQRFRFRTDDGRWVLLVLAHGDAATLARWRDAGTRLRVTYRADPGLLGAGVALSARPVEP